MVVEIEGASVAGTTMLCTFVDIAVANVAPKMESGIIDACSDRVKFLFDFFSVLVLDSNHGVSRIRVCCSKG